MSFTSLFRLALLPLALLAAPVWAQTACPPGQQPICLSGSCLCVPAAASDPQAVYDRVQRMATLALQNWIQQSRDRLVAGSLVPAAWVQQAQRVRHRAYLEALALFEHYDVLIAPATPVSATPIGADWLTLAGKQLPARASMGLLTQPISAIGLPVCTAPTWPELDEDGHLPLGVQLIAAPWREIDCLRAAHALEQAGAARVRPV